MATKKQLDAALRAAGDQQKALDDLFGAASSLLDQMFRGSHSPTRMQCMMLAAALEQAAPLIRPRPGNSFDFVAYTKSLSEAVDNLDSYIAKRRGSLRRRISFTPGDRLLAPKLVIMENEYKGRVEWSFRAYDSHDELNVETFHTSQGDAMAQVSRSMAGSETYEVVADAVLVG